VGEAWQATSSTYDRIAEVYAERATVTPALRAHLGRFIAAVAPHGIVLDAGSGPGQLAAVLAQQGLRTLALDSSHEMLRLAGGSVPVVRGDLRRPPLQTSRWTASGPARASCTCRETRSRRLCGHGARRCDLQACWGCPPRRELTMKRAGKWCRTRRRLSPTRRQCGAGSSTIPPIDCKACSKRPDSTSLTLTRASRTARGCRSSRRCRPPRGLKKRPVASPFATAAGTPAGSLPVRRSGFRKGDRRRPAVGRCGKACRHVEDSARRRLAG